MYGQTTKKQLMQNYIL